jgi:hypothetical protein
MMNTATAFKFDCPTSTFDLTSLAREINDAHRQVRLHAKGMLLEAKRAGEALLKAKTLLPTDRLFGQWREANTEVGQRQAHRYMEVARRWEAQTRGADFDHLADISIREFLGIKDKPKSTASHRPFSQAARYAEWTTFAKAQAPFPKEDAELAMKLFRLADGGANANESDVAFEKLDRLAAKHNMDRDTLVGMSKRILGIRDEVAPDPAREKRRILREKFMCMSKEDLVTYLMIATWHYPDLVDVFERDKA